MVMSRSVRVQPRTGGAPAPATLDNLAAELGITPMEEIVEPLKIFIYGDSGVGKTVLASTLADIPEMHPTLYINVEGGTRSIKARQGLFNVNLKTAADASKLQAYLRQMYGPNGEAKWRAIIFDGITEYRVMQSRSVLVAACREDASHDREVLSIRDWQRVYDRTREFARFLRDLPVYVIVTALQETIKDEDTGALHIMPMLSEKLNGSVPGYFDIVGYLCTAEVSRGGPRVRRLYVQPTERRRGKDRSDELGEYLDDPTMPKLLAKAQPRGLFAAPKSTESAEADGDIQITEEA